MTDGPWQEVMKQARDLGFVRGIRMAFECAIARGQVELAGELVNLLKNSFELANTPARSPAVPEADHARDNAKADVA